MIRGPADARHAHHGMALLDEAKPEEALAELQEARQIAGNNPAWPVWLGLAAIDVGNYELARQSLREALKLGPGNELAQQIGWLLDLREGKTVEALEQFVKHRPLDNSRLLGRLMLEVERILLVAHPPPVEGGMVPEPAPHNLLKEVPARRTFKRGMKLLEAIQIHTVCCMAEERKVAEQAIPLLESALTDDATIPRGWFYLGVAYLSAGRYGQAEVCFEKSVQDDGETMDNQYCLGRVLHETGRLDEARGRYQHAVELFEKLPEAYLGWGQVLLQLGLESEARVKLGRAAHYWMDFAYERIELALKVAQEGDAPQPCKKCKGDALPRHTPVYQPPPSPEPEPEAPAPETTL